MSSVTKCSFVVLDSLLLYKIVLGILQPFKHDLNCIGRLNFSHENRYYILAYVNKNYV